MQTLDYRDPEWVSEQLGLERNTVYKYLKEGIIPAVRIGKKWLISESKLAIWLEEETEKQTQSRQEATGSINRTLKRMDNYTAEAREVLKSAHTLARNCGHEKLGQEHLLVAMVEDQKCMANAKLKQIVADLQTIEHLFGQQCPETEKKVPRRLGRSVDAKKAMKMARDKAGTGKINSVHILEGIMELKTGKGYDILRAAGLEEVLEC